MQKAFHRLGVVAAVAWLGFVSLFLMIEISDGQIMQHLGTFSGLVLCAPVTRASDLWAGLLSLCSSNPQRHEANNQKHADAMWAPGHFQAAHQAANLIEEHP